MAMHPHNDRRRKPKRIKSVNREKGEIEEAICKGELVWILLWFKCGGVFGHCFCMLTRSGGFAHGFVCLR